MVCGRVDWTRGSATGRYVSFGGRVQSLMRKTTVKKIGAGNFIMHLLPEDKGARAGSAISGVLGPEEKGVKTGSAIFFSL